MNGYASGLVFWALNILVGLVAALIGVILKMHLNSDDEHREEMKEEIERLRDRLHKIEGTTSGIVAMITVDDRSNRIK